MPDATSRSGLTQTTLARVIICRWFQATIGLQFFTQFLARTGEPCFDKGNANVGVDGAKGIVGDVHLSEGGCAEER